MRIALNIADLTRCEVAGILLSGVIPNRIIVRGEQSQWDDGALVLECEERRARAIADLIRTGDHHHKRYPTRVYVEGPRGGWTKVTNGDKLCEEPLLETTECP